jgi:hypothetical protein
MSYLQYIHAENTKTRLIMNDHVAADDNNNDNSSNANR